MSDLVKRLREPVDWAHFVNEDHACDYAELMGQAADALEAQQREIDELEIQIVGKNVKIDELTDKLLQLEEQNTRLLDELKRGK